MLSKEDILSFLADNRVYFYKTFGITRIGLFGSYSRGDQTSLSDIDLVVDFEPGTENLFEKKIELKKYISDKLGITPDICREKYIKKRIRFKINQQTTYAY
jgi:predicted nucleotidyltransferase